MENTNSHNAVMTKSEFFKRFGGDLIVTNPDDYQYGEHIVISPEEDHVAVNYSKEGYRVFTLFEEPAEGQEELVHPYFEAGKNPYKVGYYILNKPVTSNTEDVKDIVNNTFYENN